MANFQIIKDLAKQRNISLESIAKELNITPQALSKLMRLNSTKVDTMERIASILNVSPKIFFETEEERQIRINLMGENGKAQLGDYSSMTLDNAQLLKYIGTLIETNQKLANKLIEKI